MNCDVRIVAWNVNHGHGSVILSRLHATLGADLVLLQETERPVWHGSSAWEPVPGYDHGSAVLSASGTLLVIPIVGYEGWVVGGELSDSSLNLPGRRLVVFSVHAPTSTTNRLRGPYIEEVVRILDLIGKQLGPQADVILGGDFNFLSLGIRKDGESIETTPAEHEALSRFTDLGLVSCWTATHPGRALAQTLRWSGDKTPDRSIPFHSDGIFVPDSWRTWMFCEILTSASFEVSDHYPVAAWISR
jgi:endonuclease/exonuclease/phosphatase family metal-dependent hydrolase